MGRLGRRGGGGEAIPATSRGERFVDVRDKITVKPFDFIAKLSDICNVVSLSLLNSVRIGARDV